MGRRQLALTVIAVSSCRYDEIRLSAAEACSPPAAPVLTPVGTPCGQAITLTLTFEPAPDGVIYDVEVHDGAEWQDLALGAHETELDNVGPGKVSLRSRASAVDCRSDWLETVVEVLPGPGVPLLEPMDYCGSVASSFVSWTPATGVTYTVQWSNDGVQWNAPMSSSQGSASHSGLPAGQYAWRIAASDGDCTTPFEEYGFEIVPPAAAPTVVDATSVCDDAVTVITWSGDWSGSQVDLVIDRDGLGPLGDDDIVSPHELDLPPGNYGAQLVIEPRAPCTASAYSSIMPFEVRPLPVQPSAAQAASACVDATLSLNWSGGQLYGSYAVETTYRSPTMTFDATDVQVLDEGSAQLATTDTAGSFQWRVRHETEFCGESEWATAGIFVSNQLPVRPTAPTSPDTCGSQPGQLSWSGTLGSYEVAVSDDGGSTYDASGVTVSGTSASFTAALPGIYPWRVRHATVCGFSEWLDGTLLVQPPPVTPTNLFSAGGLAGSDIALSWDRESYGAYDVRIDYGAGFVTDGITVDPDDLATLNTDVVGTHEWRVLHFVPGCSMMAMPETAVVSVLEPPSGQPGTADTTFGDDGRVATQLNLNAYSSAVGVAAIGSVIFVGGTIGATDKDFALARYSLDSGTFGDVTVAPFNGVGYSQSIASTFAADLSGPYFFVGGVVVEPPGFLAPYPDIGVAMFDADGDLHGAPMDACTYDGVFEAFSYENYSRDSEVVSAHRDGRLVLFSTTSDSTAGDDYGTVVVLDTTTCTFDSSFWGGRPFNVNIAQLESVRDIAIDGSGRIVLSLVTAGPSYLARLLAEGGYDGSFGSLGVQTTDLIPGPIAVASDDSIFVAGTFSGAPMLAHYDVAGVLESSYDDDGYADIGAVGTSFAAIALDSSDRVVVVGTHSGVTLDYFVGRLNTDGDPDDTFTPGGWVAFDFAGGDDTASGLTFQADGKILVAGASDNAAGTVTRVGLLRVNP